MIDETGSRSQTCEVAGCELVGTRSISIDNKEHRWWCRYHFGQPASDCYDITERIEKALPLIRHVDRLKKASPVDILNREPFLFHYAANEKFSIGDDEKYSDYVSRLQRHLSQYIKGGKTNFDKPEKQNTYEKVINNQKETPK